MDLGLSARTAVVLGAGGGIGGGIAEALAAEGATVACVDRDLAGAEACVDRVDILINNTGGPPSTTAHGVALDIWREYFESMVVSVIHLTDLVLPSMRERGWGRIVTSASSGVIVPIAMLGISNTLRSSLVGWSKSVSREVGPDGVTSNVIVPGRIGSQRAIDLDEKRAAQQGRTVEEVRAAYFERIPARRYGTPREYGDAVAFLASERAGYINGAVLRVDGGMIESV
jgi:3-oxoacyl-[acyl-carrier protein] reductase